MKVVILGAGVAGTSTAIALSKQGHEVKVYERRREPTIMGAGIVLWPNASFVLSELGLLKAIEAVSGTPTSMKRMSETGELLSEMDIGALDRAMGFASHAILRRDFQRILLDETARLDISVEYGCCACDIQKTADGAMQVLFDNGQCEEADLIIGADGRMNSVARKYIHGDIQPVYQGFVNWIGVLQANAPLVPDLSVLDVWGIGKRFGVAPISHDKLYWAGALAIPEPMVERSDSNDELEILFADWPDPVGKIIAMCDASSIRKIDIYDLEPVDLWHKDSVLMIGDAAHAALPTSGQGACQALEDAWHLAKYFPLEKKHLQEALAIFTSKRLRKTHTITQSARHLARSLFDSDPASCRLRDEQARGSDPTAH